MKRNIVVVGSGILGLSSAIKICEELGDQYNIYIVAEHFPDSYPFEPEFASPWAGAHFRPFPNRSKSDERNFALTRYTQEYFRYLARECPESSIRFVKGVEYLEEPDSFYSNVSRGYREEMNNFELLPEKSLPLNFKFGCIYDTWVANPLLLLQYLQRRLVYEFDAHFILARLDSLKDALKYVQNSSVIINCSGRGLQYYGGYDESCFPMRGQTLLIKTPSTHPYNDKTITYVHKHNLWTFCIPRPLHGGMIIGGTKQPGDLYRVPKDEDTKALLRRAGNYFPELMKKNEKNADYFDIESINVGFRPMREKGLNISVDRHQEVTVVHAYGAGGMGYELSFGVGHAVCDILNNIFKNNAKL